MEKVEDWNETVLKLLVVGMCLAMVGMVVMPGIEVTDLAGVIAGAYAGYHADSQTGAVIDGAYYGLMASSIPTAAYLGLIAAGVATGGTALIAGLAIAA